MTHSIRVQRIHPNALIPKYMSSGASGCDVSACLEEPIRLRAGQRMAVPTGLKVEIPEGYEIQVRPRSGLAFKQGVTVINAPGTIDSDYRGEVKILLINLGQEDVIIEPGDRVAQLIVQKVHVLNFEEVATLSDTQRAEGGFGSTGVQRPTH